MKPRAQRNRERRRNRQRLPRPAPGPLATVQAFLNTRNLQTGTDELASPSTLGAWLSSHGLISATAKVTRKQLRRALDLRDGLHAIVMAHSGAALDAAAVARLNEASRGARIEVRFDREGDPRFEPASTGVAEALGRLLGMVAAARFQGDWSRLKACADSECRAAFYEEQSGRGLWCSHRCGDRMRARTHLSRRK